MASKRGRDRGRRVTRIPRELDGRILRGLFTIDAGESLLVGTVTAPAKADSTTASPAPPLQASVAPVDEVDPLPPTDRPKAGSARPSSVADGTANKLSGRARKPADRRDADDD